MLQSGDMALRVDGPGTSSRLDIRPMRLDMLQTASEREKSLAKFNTDQGKPRILLVAVDLDALSLKMQCASIVMICEPLWTGKPHQKIVGQVNALIRKWLSES